MCLQKLSEHRRKECAPRRAISLPLRQIFFVVSLKDASLASTKQPMCAVLPSPPDLLGPSRVFYLSCSAAMVRRLCMYSNQNEHSPIPQNIAAASNACKPTPARIVMEAIAANPHPSTRPTPFTVHTEVSKKSAIRAIVRMVRLARPQYASIKDSRANAHSRSVTSGLNVLFPVTSKLRLGCEPPGRPWLLTNRAPIFRHATPMAQVQLKRKVICPGNPISHAMPVG